MNMHQNEWMKQYRTWIPADDELHFFWRKIILARVGKHTLTLEEFLQEKCDEKILMEKEENYGNQVGCATFFRSGSIELFININETLRQYTFNNNVVGAKYTGNVTTNIPAIECNLALKKGEPYIKEQAREMSGSSWSPSALNTRNYTLWDTKINPEFLQSQQIVIMDQIRVLCWRGKPKIIYNPEQITPLEENSAIIN